MKQKLFLLLALPFCWANSWAEDVTISSAAELVTFATRVNAGETSLNATLTANIDLNGTAWTPIGNSTNKYAGTFDGQGYTITNFSYTSTGNGGLFGYIENATIKNFSIAGSIDVTGGTASGVIGYSKSSTISGIHSSLAITTSAGTAVGHVGGVVGSLNQNDNVSGCSFSGSITANANSHNCFGGIAGYMTNNDKIQNCANHGSITYSKNNCYAGGIEGYINSTSAYILNCLSTGAVTYVGTGTASYGGAIVGYMKSTYNSSNFSNNYWLEGCAAKAYGSKTDEANETTATKLASGEVCYLLNENISGGTNWYQTLPGDAYPVLDSTHGLVYTNGIVCPDTGTLQEGTVSYSNTEGTTVGSHNPVDGFCTYCGTLDATYMTVNSEGYYEIGNEKQLKWFSAKVNSGDMTINAILTNSIDMSNLTSWTAIGDWGGLSGTSSACYKGHFDGQGYTISNFNFDATHNYYGLFGVISTGALIENFTIEGSITVDGNIGYAASVVAYARDKTPTIRNVHSKVNISSTSTASTPRLGGIVGGCPQQNSQSITIIDRCTYSGILNANNKGGNYGGIVGYIYNSTNVSADITNCLFDGKLKGTVDSNKAQYGGIIGYTRKGIVSVSNCLSLGTFEYEEGNAMNIGQFIGRLAFDDGTSGCTFDNNYYVDNGYALYGTSSGGAANGAAPTEVTDAQLASGEVAYKLGSAWYQTIDTDTYPTLSSNSEQVLYVGDAGYTTFYDATQGYTLNGDAQAYIGSFNGSAIHLIEIEDIPADVAVVINGTYYNRTSAASTAGDATGNVLLGSDGNVTGGSNIYALAQKNDVVGFYPVADGVTIPAGKAYIEYEGAGVKGFTFVFDGDDATGISNKSFPSEEDLGEAYNLAGQMVNGKLPKGIYIVSGKKIAVK